MTNLAPYSSLPKPDVIELLDYATLRDELIAEVEAAFLELGVSYNVGQLESDPVVIQAEVYANREHRLRQRINDAMRAYMVPFSSGADLDMLGSFYDSFRLVGETDEAFRYRIVEGIRGRSPGGSKHWYSYNALSAHPNVRSVAVDLVPGAPQVQVAVLSYDNGGIATQSLLNAVQTRLRSDEVKVVSDTITAVAAVFQTVNISANVWLLTGAPYSVFEGLDEKLKAAWAAKQDLGVDLTTSWIIANLMGPEVHKVTLTTPTADVVAASNRAIAIGTVTLTFKGYDR
jgi:phage-related baseplate assembly protein